MYLDTSTNQPGHVWYSSMSEIMSTSVYINDNNKNQSNEYMNVARTHTNAMCNVWINVQLPWACHSVATTFVTLTLFQTYKTRWKAQYGIQIDMSKIHPDFVICWRVTAHPLASNSRINMNVDCKKHQIEMLSTILNCIWFVIWYVARWLSMPRAHTHTHTQICQFILPGWECPVCRQWFWLYRSRSHSPYTVCNSST